MKKKQKYKIRELKPVSKDKFGKILLTNPNLERHEEATILLLASLGFDIEAIIPSNMPGSKNPDLLMAGTFWEMKAPTKYNETTSEAKFRKAVKQSGGKAVFDLRNIEGYKDATAAEDNIIKLFGATRGMRRIILIKKDGRALDIIK